MGKFTTIARDGKKSVEDFIKDGQKWYADKLAEGWEKTPDGILPLTEIKKAGYAQNENKEWVIPVESYIADGNSDRPAGQKYWGVSMQYIRWKKNKSIEDAKSRTQDTIKQLNFTNKEEVIKKERPVTDSFKTDDDIDVESIPF